ncbi:MAG: hypothetical protein IJR99_01625 [Kiritimatiellae bacterium]|nr:hypothetical protein [Kiritimatiellia bacterium]
MKLSEVIEKSGLEAVLVPDPDAEVAGVYTSDLLSDVMAHCEDEFLLVTVQNHKNSVAVCTLVGAPALIIVHNRPLPEDMVAAAKQEGIALLRTDLDQFGISVRLASILGIQK